MITGTTFCKIFCRTVHCANYFCTMWQFVQQYLTELFTSQNCKSDDSTVSGQAVSDSTLDSIDTSCIKNAISLWCIWGLRLVYHVIIWTIICLFDENCKILDMLSATLHQSTISSETWCYLMLLQLQMIS